MEKVLANLRHLYHLLHTDTVKSQPEIAEKLLSPIIQELEKLHAPVAGEAVPRGIIDAARNAGFSFLRHADGSYTMQQIPRATAQTSELLRALISLHAVARIDRDEDYAAVSNAAEVIAKHAAPQASKAVRDAIETCAKICDGRSASLMQSQMLSASNEAHKCGMAIRSRAKELLSLSAQPGVQKKGS